MDLKYKQELTTKSYFVNRFGKLSTSFLFWQIQDIAWEHAELLGFGFDNLKEEQQFWHRLQALHWPINQMGLKP